MPSGIVADGIGLMSFGMVYCCNRSPAGEVVPGCDMRLLSAACRSAANFASPVGALARPRMSSTPPAGTVGSAGPVAAGVSLLSITACTLSGSSYLPLIQGNVTTPFPVGEIWYSECCKEGANNVRES